MNQNGQHELVLERMVKATPEQMWRAWTDPELMKQWFTPAPWKTVHVETDVRVGGASLIVMQGPDGNEFPNRGVYLEVVPHKKLVFTDAYVSAWEPSAKPFMTGILTFEAEGDATRYKARVLHWSEEDRLAHEKMGFHEGWGKATHQLEALFANR